MGETKEGIIMFYLGFLARVGLFVFRIYAKHLTKNRVKPNALDTDTVWDVGFRYTYLPERFIEERNTVYSENALVPLPLNPTYVLLRYSEFRLIWFPFGFSVLL